MPLLEVVRALTAFSPPSTTLPPFEDLALLGDVLEAHGLAPLASYQLESTRLGANVPDALRERLLSSYQGVVNDNLQKVLALRALLKDAPELQVVVLEGAAYLEWLYPRLAFRPVGDLRLALRGSDGARFAAHAREHDLSLVRTEHEGRTAVFTDGSVTLVCQEGHFAGAPPDEALFRRSSPYRVFGAGAGRPSTEDAILSTVGEQALMGLLAPLLTYVDLRELLRLPIDHAYLKERAEALGLTRALHGATLLAAHFFPDVADSAAAARPALAFAERVAVERVVDAAKDPSRLRHLRGADQAARLVVAP